MSTTTLPLMALTAPSKPNPTTARFISFGTGVAPTLIAPIRSAKSLLDDTSLVPPPELVRGLLHRSTKAVFAGSSKVGKTWILMDLAIAVASGGSFLQWDTTRGRVLFINLEIQQNFFRDRLRTAASKRGLDEIENLDVMNLRGMDTDAGPFLLQIARQVQDHDYSLIVIDPVYKLMVGRSENSASGVGKLCHGIERLMEKSKAAVVYSHHFTKGKQAGKKAMDRLSGSGVFARDADTIVTFTEHKVEGCFVVESTLRNMASPDPFVVEWEYPRMLIREDLDPSELQDGKRQDHPELTDFVLSLLEERPLTSTEWLSAALEAGISRATYFRKTSVLRATGAVHQDPETKCWSRAVNDI